MSTLHLQLDLLPAPHSFRTPAAEEEDAPPDGSTDEWFTLDEDFFEAERLYGPFDLDPFATRENARCKRFFTLAEDGLKQSYEDAAVFSNPPYSDLPRCTTKALWEILRAQRIVQYLPVWTDRLWWEPYEQLRKARLLEVDLLTGRRRFGWPGMPKGAKGKVAKFPSMRVIMRGTPELRAAVKHLLEQPGGFAALEDLRGDR